MRSGEHPRARGENRIFGSFAVMSDGTSPRTRGKLLRSIASTESLRNIPAHAGKTIGSRVDIGLGKEHPRARGENNPNPTLLPHQAGTSPRTRGKRDSIICGIIKRGNIPAHAGKTFGSTGFFRTGREHPRARGENSLGYAADEFTRGTSPRTRGKRGQIPDGPGR